MNYDERLVPSMRDVWGDFVAVLLRPIERLTAWVNRLLMFEIDWSEFGRTRGAFEAIDSIVAIPKLGDAVLTLAGGRRLPVRWRPWAPYCSPSTTRIVQGSVWDLPFEERMRATQDDSLLARGGILSKGPLYVIADGGREKFDRRLVDPSE